MNLNLFAAIFLALISLLSLGAGFYAKMNDKDDWEVFLIGALFAGMGCMAVCVNPSSP